MSAGASCSAALKWAGSLPQHWGADMNMFMQWVHQLKQELNRGLVLALRKKADMPCAAWLWLKTLMYFRDNNTYNTVFRRLPPSFLAKVYWAPTDTRAAGLPCQGLAKYWFYKGKIKVLSITECLWKHSLLALLVLNRILNVAVSNLFHCPFFPCIFVGQSLESCPLVYVEALILWELFRHICYD